MIALTDEARIVWRDTLFRTAVVLILILTGVALWNGRQFQTGRDAMAQSEIQRSIDKRVKAQETLRLEASGEVPVNPWGASEPTRADWNATRPAGPLAALSFGREDLEPLSASVSLWMVRDDNLFRKYEFASPLALASGRFDAGFLVILLLPLFVLALTYNVVADERTSGRLRLSLVQGGVRRRLLIRFLLRLAPVFGALVLIGVTGLVWGLAPGRLGLWLLGAAIYLAFWSAIAIALATLRARQELLALLGAGVWLALVVVVPALGVAAAQSIAPSPSPFTVINGARDASLAANRRLLENLQGYVSDHPDLMEGGASADDWAAKLYVSQVVIGEEIAPVMAEAAARSAAQDRWISRLRFLSPASTSNDLLVDTAGSGRARQAAYVEQVRLFLGRWKAVMSPMIFARARLTPPDIDRLPVFTFVEPPVDRDRSAASLFGLIAFALAAAVAAGLRLWGIGRSPNDPLTA